MLIKYRVNKRQPGKYTNMKRSTVIYFGLVIIAACFVACSFPKKDDAAAKSAYMPDSKALYDSIVILDSTFFTAYNNCDLVKMASLISEDLEFYHDKGGLMTSKDSVMAAIKKNICGKVTRVLVKGSIEVYPIAGYGAVEMGQHYFINSEEPETVEHKIGKFVQLWKNENGNWRMARIISLH